MSNCKVNNQKGLSNSYTAVDITYWDDCIYILNAARHTLEKFSSNGNYIETVFRDKYTSNANNHYDGLGVDPEGDFYYSDSNNNKIYKLEKDT